MNNTKKLLISKYTLYALLLVALYVLQTVPGLFVVLGCKPFLVIPAAIAIAMHEGEFAGGIYGAAAGLFCDMGGHLLFGFNGFLIALSCIAAGLLVIYLMRCNLPGGLLLVFACMLARGSLEYLFGYGMWRYEDVWRVYAYKTLPTVALTCAVTPPLYLLVRAIYRKFEKLLARD